MRANPPGAGGTVNAWSIGIELVNPGHAFGYRPFAVPQMAALIGLAKGILARHDIPLRNVVGHADVAPARKDDPGELFPWRQLAEEGIGLWPGAAPGVADAVSPAVLLRRYGYPVPELAGERQALTAFQRHFRPNRCDGEADAETMFVLRRLVAAAEAG